MADTVVDVCSNMIHREHYVNLIIPVTPKKDIPGIKED